MRPGRRLISFLTAGLVFTSPLNAGRASVSPPAPLTLELAHWCDELSHELKSVVHERCTKRGWKFDIASDGGHPIAYLLWGAAATTPPAAATGAVGEGDARRVLIFGAIHGDEISAVSTVFRWIDFLERTKPDSFLRKNVYMFFPLVNPDGFYSKPRTRTNKSGVDINRNFATREWDSQALLFWKKKASADPRRFPGKKPGSERETMVVEKAINEFKPDLIISVHAPYRLVDHDGPIMFPDLQSPLPVRTLGAYPGSLGTYAGIERNIPVVTPELPDATHLPEGKAVEQLFIFIMKSKF